jgi:hypothetical protein
MYRFLGIVLLAITLAACQPATTSPTKTVDVSASSAADTASSNDVIWQSGNITPVQNGDDATTVLPSLQADESSMVIEGVMSEEDSYVEPTDVVVMLVPDAALQAAVDALNKAAAGDTENTDIDTLEKAIVAVEKQDEIASLDPNLLVGHNMEALGRDLGLPDFERSEANVMIWQYRLAACVTDFFLYLDGDTYVVTAWAWRTPVVGTVLDPESCKQELGNLADKNA